MSRYLTIIISFILGAIGSSIIGLTWMIGLTVSFVFVLLVCKRFKHKKTKHSNGPLLAIEKLDPDEYPDDYPFKYVTTC